MVLQFVKTRNLDVLRNSSRLSVADLARIYNSINFTSCSEIHHAQIIWKISMCWKNWKQELYGNWAVRNDYINHLLHLRLFSAANNLRSLRWAGNITCNYILIWTQSQYCGLHIIFWYFNKAKLSHDRPGEALGLQEVETPGVSRQSANEDSKVVHCRHWPPLPPGHIPGTHFS